MPRALAGLPQVSHSLFECEVIYKRSFCFQTLKHLTVRLVKVSRILMFGGTDRLANKRCLKSFPRKEYFLDLPYKFFKNVPFNFYSRKQSLYG